MNRLLPLLVFVTAAASAAACGKSTGVVPQGPHLPEQEPPPVRVRLAPPPVKVEAMPLRRNQDCFFRDGAWTPAGSGWNWIDGEWILPPEGCYYAPPRTSYEDIGVGTALVHRAGAWHPIEPGQPKCEKPRECPSSLDY